MTPLVEVVAAGSGWLVVNKPADLVCHPTKDGEMSSLIGRLRLHCGPAGTPVMINRLDRESSGLVLVATERDCARELGRLWETRGVRKSYLALVHGHPEADEGVVEAPLGRDETSRVAIKDKVRGDGISAQTAYRVLCRFARQASPFSLLQVEPRTGRKHQIRIHLASLGHPIVGDKLYGGDEDLYLALVEGRLTEAQRDKLILKSHGLHAWRLSFSWRGRDHTFEAAPPAEFREFVRDNWLDLRSDCDRSPVAAANPAE